MSSHESGLGLFDEAASAAGNFPTSLRGYDRSAVDDYVRSIESSLVEARRALHDVQAQVDSLTEELAQVHQQLESDEVDYTNLGGRATDILRLAEEQAHEMLDRAGVDAEKAREDAVREADAIRQSAAREGGDLKSTGLAELDRLRTQLEAAAQAEIERARAESEALVAAARRQGDALRQQAEHEAQTVRQTAYLDTEGLRRGVESEVATIRQQAAAERERVAAEREQALAQLRADHDQAMQQTAALIAEATQHNQESAARLEADIAEASRIRTEALTQAEQVRLLAATEAEDRLEEAKKQAAAITDRTQREFGWRRQQLKRETDLLTQRKQAVLNQLASLSALAQQTASTFPDLEDLGDFDAETGDQTIVRRPDAPPARPSPDADPADTETAVRPLTVTAPDPEPRASSAPEPAAMEEETPTHENAEFVVDGDATVVVPPGSRPAGPVRSANGGQRDEAATSQH